MKESDIRKIINYLLVNLEEIKKIENNSKSEFTLGEKTAYVEILEILQELDKNKKLGLNFNIEERYPL